MAYHRVNVSDPTTGTSTNEKLLKKYGFGPIPEKRGNRAGYFSLVIFIISTAFVLSIFIKEKPNSSVILNCALITIGVMLAAFVNCVSLAFEELFHVKKRYEGDYWKMLTKCFSGVNFSVNVVVVMLAVMLIYVCLGATEKSLHPIHAAVIFSSIGIGSFMHHLLKLGKQYEVQISSICEENKSFVATGLAWHYYLDRLKVILPKLIEQHETESERENQLDSNKLLILIPLDCIIKNLTTTHTDIYEDGVIRCTQKSYDVSVYRIGDGDNSRRIMIEFPSPLNTIFERCKDNGAKNEQVRIFYRELNDILEANKNEYQRSYMLIPYKTNTLPEHGGLAKLIAAELDPSPDEDEITGQSEEHENETTSRQSRVDEDLVDDGAIFWSDKIHLEYSPSAPSINPVLLLESQFAKVKDTVDKRLSHIQTENRKSTLVRHMDYLTRFEICQRLNTVRILGGDYRELARAMGMLSFEIQMISEKSDPADELLKWWETRSNATVSKLRELLLHMGREDLVEILDSSG